MLGFVSFLYDSTPFVSSMSSPIAFREFSEDDYRKFVRTLSDEELIKAGKRLRFLSGNGKIVTTMPCAFYEQLKICREEYRRRFPGAWYQAS